jgi:peptide/nickel transport system ATP-binding protein/oligopeptide transport system ATP-binding protein
MITHNLGVIAEVSERVGVMYAGRLVEMADAVNLFEEPLHPYTQGLLLSVPRIDRDIDKFTNPLQEISGVVPSLIDLPEGCKFRPRCAHATERCAHEEPPLTVEKENHWVRCW